MHWYKHYVADYQQDTADLTLIEHGAYRALLDAYYQREGPLPSDPKLLYRITHAHSKAERAAVKRMVSAFFTSVDGHVLNVRADKEIVKYQAQCSANRRPNRVQNSEREIDRDKELRSKPVDKSLERIKISNQLPAYLHKKPDDLTP